MEDVLFDLYIAEIEIREGNSTLFNDSAQKQYFLNSVFEKHRISEETFDTSLVWYNANLDSYLKINNRLAGRYDLLLTEFTEEKERLIASLTVIDTIFLHDPSTFTLQSKLKDNIYGFNINVPDSSTLREYDVKFFAMGVQDSIRPILTFSIQCKDTTFIQRDTLTQNGWFDFRYSAPRNHKIQSVYGNFHLPSKEDNHLFIGDFTISQTKTTIHSDEKIIQSK